MKTFERTYFNASTIDEAVEMMTKYPGALYLAGGTDVYLNKQQGNLDADFLIDLSNISSLKQISINDNYIEIGSMITLDQVIQNKELTALFPVLREAAMAIATPVIRKTATIGGNILCENRCSFYNQSEWWREAVGYCLKCSGDICIATGGRKNCFSKFVSDLAPVLIALEAKAFIVDPHGERSVRIEELYTGDGVNSLAISKKSLIKSIVVPKQISKVIFKKLRPRKTLDFTSLTTAISLNSDKNLRIVIGGVDPRPVLIEGPLADVELLLAAASKKPRVVENDYYSRKYRKEMIDVFVRQSIEELMQSH